MTHDVTAMPSPERVEPPLVADERTLLDAGLDLHRATYARPNGHADLLPQSIDGATGD